MFPVSSIRPCTGSSPQKALSRIEQKQRPRRKNKQTGGVKKHKQHRDPTERTQSESTEDERGLRRRTVTVSDEESSVELGSTPSSASSSSESSEKHSKQWSAATSDDEDLSESSLPEMVQFIVHHNSAMPVRSNSNGDLSSMPASLTSISTAVTPDSHAAAAAASESLDDASSFSSRGGDLRRNRRQRGLSRTSSGQLSMRELLQVQDSARSLMDSSSNHTLTSRNSSANLSRRGLMRTMSGRESLRDLYSMSAHTRASQQQAAANGGVACYQGEDDDTTEEEHSFAESESTLGGTGEGGDPGVIVEAPPNKPALRREASSSLLSLGNSATRRPRTMTRSTSMLLQPRRGPQAPPHSRGMSLSLRRSDALSLSGHGSSSHDDSNSRPVNPPSTMARGSLLKRTASLHALSATSDHSANLRDLMATGDPSSTSKTTQQQQGRLTRQKSLLVLDKTTEILEALDADSKEDMDDSAIFDEILQEANEFEEQKKKKRLPSPSKTPPKLLLFTSKQKQECL